MPFLGAMGFYADGLDDSIPRELQQILVLLKKETGHNFFLYTPNTIFRRIQKRMDILKIDTLAAYYYYLHQHPTETSILFKEFLINVTSFFRNEEAFDLLQKILINKLQTEKFDHKYFRVWVPGCSTGEEAYSIAMILQECMYQLNIHCNVKIFGTDIDEDAIRIARSGIYPSNIEKEVSPKRLKQFFTKEGDQYKINFDVRKMITFANQNVIIDPSFTKLNLLSCRNLLIYLKSPLKKRIIPLFHYSLAPQGILFLGPTENIGTSLDCFSILDKRWKLFERKDAQANLHSNTNNTPTNSLAEATTMKMTERKIQENESNLAHLIKNILLKSYTPASVVIDERGEIVCVYGRTSKFLEFALGEVRLQLIDMIRPEFKSKLNTAIHKALEEQNEVIINHLQYKEGDEIKYANIVVRFITESEAIKRNLLLIIIEEIKALEFYPDINKKLDTKGEINKKIAQLEQELKYTRENLQSIIEALETSNEELKSSIEELQSTNEELQSTNEEIETSKEELQSLNEELTSVHAELENRIEQLSCANDDIINLLDNTEIATIFLGNDLCIKRFTPKATEIINLIPTDVGRPISHIVSNLKYEKLVEDARTALRTLEPVITEVIDKMGHWYLIKINPYRTVTNLLEGVVITFLSIYPQKMACNAATERSNSTLSLTIK